MRTSIQLSVRWLFWCFCTWGSPAVSMRADELPAAPQDIQVMLDAGQVKLEFYDSRANPRQFLGETKYDYFFRHSYRADYEPIRVAGRTTAVKIQLRNVTVTTTLTHTIHLPEWKRGPEFWQDPLTRHEFDHVAQSIDPRILKLLEEVLHLSRELRVPLPAGQALNADWINAEIDKHLSARGQAVYAIVSYNNRQLDQLTAHGVKPVPEREAYFRRLYTKPNLDEAGFAFTGEVLELLKSEIYQQLEPQHLP